MESPRKIGSAGPRRSTSPTSSVTSCTSKSSSRSWAKNYNQKYPRNVSNFTAGWRENPKIIESDADESESLKSQQRPINKEYKKFVFMSRRILDAKSPADDKSIFLKPLFFNTYGATKLAVNKKSNYAFERKDWFGLKDGKFCGKDLKLKYLHIPEFDQIDLTAVHEEDKLYLPVDINEHINEILTWIRSDFFKPSIFAKYCSDVNFICSRLELANIMAMPYMHDNSFSYSKCGIDIAAVRLKGKIYLCTFFTLDEKNHRSKDMKLPSATAGLIFQKNLLSDYPDKLPNLDLPFDRKEAEYFLVDKVSFGEHKVFVQNKFKGVCQENELDDLKNFDMFEVKTAKKPYVLRNLFTKYVRCLAGNSNRVIIGVKDDESCKTHGIEFLTKDDLLQQCQELFLAEKKLTERGLENITLHPQPQVCMNFTEKFLSYVKQTLLEDTKPDEVYKFEYRVNKPGLPAIFCQKLTGKKSLPYRFITPAFTAWLKK